MRSTVVEVAAAPGRARVTMSSGAGQVLVPRLLGRTATGANVALVAGGALLLGGDHLHVTLRVGDGCTLELTEVGGTVAYSADGRESSWIVEADLGAGATLIWHGLELVVADGAHCARRLTLTLGDDARALVRETTVLGRTGERGGRAVLVTEATRSGVPVLMECLDVAGDRPVPGVIGAHRVIDTVLLAGARPADPAGSLALAEPGALARYLGSEAHASPLPGVWEAWRSELLG